jgi:chromosome segregation ATPase
LKEDYLKTREEISQVKRAQDAWIQRSEAATEESLINLKLELRALHEQTAKSEEEAKRVQSFIEQYQKAEVAAQGVLSSLRGEVVVLSTDLALVANQCKSAQSANEATHRNIEGKSHKSEAAGLKTLNSLSDKVEVLTGSIKQVNRDQQAQIQSLDDKLNQAEAATQQKLNIFRGDVGALRTDLGQALSQCFPRIECGY